MIDDEAFIRAIVASPGDDLPRLVYADYLDERGDPRGTYLRAELEWAKPWHDSVRPPHSVRIAQMGNELEPLWVSRISRPPLGACCEHVGFEQRRQPITQHTTVALEKRFSLRLPIDYQAFLLNYNAVWSDTALHPSGEYHSHLLYIFAVNNSDGSPYIGSGDHFANTWQLQQLDLPWRLSQIQEGTGWPDLDSPVSQDYIPIMCIDEEPDGESNWILLGVRNSHFGRIAEPGYDSQNDSDTAISIAPSFAVFLSNLVADNNTLRKRSLRRRLFEP